MQKLPVARSKLKQYLVVSCCVKLRYNRGKVKEVKFLVSHGTIMNLWRFARSRKVPCLKPHHKPLQNRCKVPYGKVVQQRSGWLAGRKYFWLYEALPSLTGLDRPEAVGALERGPPSSDFGAARAWSVGALEAAIDEVR